MKAAGDGCVGAKKHTGIEYTVPEMEEVLLVNKPAGMTSQQLVTAVKRRLGVKKAGHAGTLDPLATGLMVVLIDKATKKAGEFVGLEKEYMVTIKLGVETETYDAQGEVVGRYGGKPVSPTLVEEAVRSFLGKIRQRPPAYSAVKIGGRPAYKLARKGIEVELKPREVEIREAEILSYSWPELRLRVGCSKGTYIRSLAHDIGEKLGIGAHVTSLVRTRVGEFRLEEARSLEEVSGADRT